MPYSPGFKSVHIKPVTGVMDLRSEPDEVPVGGYRYVKNFHIDLNKRLRRIPGWTRAFHDRTNNNWDLHDQLSIDPSDPNSVQYTRQSINMLYEATTPSKFSKLFAGTQNRIYALNNETGNWKVISDTLGGTAQTACQTKRFFGAQVGDTVLFTNGEDALVYHVIDQPAIETDTQSVAPVPDLVTLSVTKAKVILSWNNMILLMNIEQDGEGHPNRIMWSDYNRPIAFVPVTGSLAGYQDLDYEDSILAAKAIKNKVLIYTTCGIWELQVVGGESTFSVGCRWKSGDGGKRTLAYPNTLVSTGEEHYYFGYDAIYKYSLFDQEPVQVDWIHKGSSRIFDDIDKDRCALHSGGYQGDRSQIWWSWCKTGEQCPSESFVINVAYQFSSFVDAGFTAFVFHEPDFQESLRTFILKHCICDIAGFNQYAGFVREGGYCYAEPTYTCDTEPTVFFSSSALVDGEITVEDYTGDPDADSLYSLLGSIRINDYCADELGADECNAERAFLMAASEDYCIKEAFDVYYREECINFARGGCGAYSLNGYQSRLLSGPMDLKMPDDDKIVNRFAIEAHTNPETVPAQIILKIGSASHAVDPMTASGNCVILWEDQDPKELECLSDVDAATHDSDGTRPNDELEWALYHIGRFLYFDIVVLNASVTPVDTGGIISLSRFTFDAVPSARPSGHG